MSKHLVTFFPIGNADTCRIDLAGGQKLLFDYCNSRDPQDPKDKRIDLAEALRDDLERSDRHHFDVVAFTHLDLDHISGASDFFAFQHDTKLQGNGRVNIDELWIPAAAIIEPKLKLADAIVIQKEARYRLRNRKGIRVFSSPATLLVWLEQNGLELAEVQHLISDAGTTVPNWTLENNGLSFFVHSPFAMRQVDQTLVDRNNDALFFQVTFLAGERRTSLIISGDVASDLIEDIVKMTRDIHKRPEFLHWDINNVPHHSSYTALNTDDKGNTITIPSEKVDWYYRQGEKGGFLVSTSMPIPANDASDLPPHRQAANYYKDRAADIGGDYIVTMEFPSTDDPTEMVFEITTLGAKLLKKETRGSTAAITQRAPRAG